MKKNIWILNHYAGGMYFDKGGRHYNFAKYLKRAGYEPVVFCANSKHGNGECFFNNDVLWQEKNAEEINTPFVFVKTCCYVGNGKQRIFNMVEFYNNVKRTCKEYAKKYGKPDVIYASSVHPLAIVAGIQLAKYFGVECIGEVRDLWPLSIVELSDKFSNKSLIIKILYMLEKWMYKKCDRLIFTMEGGYDYIKEKGWDKVIPQSKVFHINNGVDLEEFNYNKEHFQIQDHDLNNDDIFKIIFTGTLVKSNNIDNMLDLAKKLLIYKNVVFLVWGDGIEKEHMLNRIESENITNIKYKGNVPKKYVPYIVSHSSLNFMHSAPTGLYRYGASPNKLFDYLASGHPILQDFTYNGDLVKRYRCGMVCTENIEDVFQQIYLLLHTDSKEILEFSNNCLKVSDDYDFKNLTKKLIQIIEK